MDFFEHQERAKRNSAVLVALFVAGVVATAASVHALVSVTVGAGHPFDPRILALSLGSTAAVVGIGTLAKFAQMSGGGRAVAEAMGGHLVVPGTADAEERRVLNVVEEMAIASGVRVPSVYVLEESGINAFAAGTSDRDAVVAVTRGCIRELTRDELQGVVAHEFSHLFHRDTRLNMRLVGWLGGIAAVSLVGRFLLRAAAGSRSSRKKEGGALVAVGLGLFLIGIVGYFFGRIIQSAVSRQREYLADASAVQYTRNPDGIAGALQKIAAGTGSRLEAPAAAEFSHFLFANGVASLFSTHPPIEERIARIRGLRVVGDAAPRLGAAPTAPTTTPSAAAFDGARAAGEPPVVPAESIRAARAGIGSPSPAEFAAAHALLDGLPAPVAAAARNPADARAVVLRLLLPEGASERRRQLAIVGASDQVLADTVGRLASVGPVRPEQRLPLLEIAASSLRSLSPAQFAAFRTVLAQAIAADGEVDRLEWTVRVVLRQVVEGRGAAPVDGRPATVLDAATVVATLAWSGAADPRGAERAWAAARTADASLPAVLPAPADCTLDALDRALRAFAGSGAPRRRALVDACVACVTADGRTTVEEAELLRAICACVSAPMPPIPAAA